MRIDVKIVFLIIIMELLINSMGKEIQTMKRPMYGMNNNKIWKMINGNRTNLIVYWNGGSQLIENYMEDTV